MRALTHVVAVAITVVSAGFAIRATEARDLKLKQGGNHFTPPLFSG